MDEKAMVELALALGKKLTEVDVNNMPCVHPEEPCGDVECDECVGAYLLPVVREKVGEIYPELKMKALRYESLVRSLKRALPAAEAAYKAEGAHYAFGYLTGAVKGRLEEFGEIEPEKKNALKVSA